MSELKPFSTGLTAARYVALAVVTKDAEIVRPMLRQQRVRHTILAGTSFEQVKGAAARLNAGKTK